MGAYNELRIYLKIPKDNELWEALQAEIVKRYIPGTRPVTQDIVKELLSEALEARGMLDRPPRE